MITKKITSTRLVLITIIFFTSSYQAQALVSSPSAVSSGTWNAEIKSTMERGKVEPNENRASYQSASIDVHQFSISKGIEGFSFGTDHFLRLDLKYFKSGREEVLGQLFYESDTGQAAIITGGLNLVHEPNYKAGLYVSVSPIANYNQEKFSVPRVDLWSTGFKSSFELNRNFFVENSLHYGSGIPGKQNSYLAFTHLFAFRLDSMIDSPASIKVGPYAELDTSERRDIKYDTAFSPQGSQDRIRSMKVGIISSIEFNITNSFYGIVNYVQKSGGYDAPATNAMTFLLGTNF